MTDRLDTSSKVEEILDKYHQQGCYEFRRSEIARDQTTVDTAKRNMRLYTQEAKAAITQLLQDERREAVEYTLDTKQCAQVALAMYKEWEKAMEPPLYIFIQFQDWLQALTKEDSKQ